MYCCVTIPICPRAPTALKGRSVPGPTGYSIPAHPLLAAGSDQQPFFRENGQGRIHPSMRSYSLARSPEKTHLCERQEGEPHR